jgi:hypothetical protein
MATLGLDLVKTKNIGEHQAVGEPLNPEAVGQHLGHPKAAGPSAQESVPHDYLDSDIEKGP